MKRISLMLYAIAAFALAAFAQENDPLASLPKEIGVYVKSASGGWEQVQDAPRPRLKTRGIFNAAANPFGRMSVNQVYKCAHAPLQFTDPKPIFYLRGIGKFGRDAEIIRLNVRKDRREVKSQSAGALRANQAGVEEKNIIEVKIVRLAPDVLTATPAESLPAGEYLFQLEEGALYDFGVSK